MNDTALHRVIRDGNVAVYLLPIAAENEDYVRPYIERSLDEFLWQSQPSYFLPVIVGLMPLCDGCL